MRITTVIAAVAGALALAAPAQAEFGLQDYSATLHDAAGQESTQAGAHASSTVSFTLNTRDAGGGNLIPDGSLRNVSVDMPAGFVGDPQATPRCSHRDFRVGDCSPLTMVGVNTLGYSAFPAPAPSQFVSPVYNLEPARGTVTQLGFQIINVSVVLTIRVRTDGSYNLTADLTDLSESLMIYSSALTLWGVPADLNGPGPFPHNAGGTYGGPGGGPRRPFLSAPTRCGEPVATTIRVRSWQQPDRWVTDTHEAPPMTGCDKLVFDPSLTVTPETALADAPSGYAVELRLPQSTDADGLATPVLRDATVTLPEGVTVSPSSASGLAGCADEQFALRSADPAACPSASRIGRVDVDTPVLDVPLTGGVYVGTPRSSDPASGEMFRIMVEARGGGVTLKLHGQVRADPLTGRLTTVFDDTPQLPFSSFRLTFDGGPQASLANPPDCGTKTVTSSLVAWSSDVAAAPAGSFAIACPGSAGFAPTFAAGTVNPVGGSFSPLALRIERRDREQELGGLSLELPPGLLARLAGVPLCGDAAAAAGACGVESRVGTAIVGAGPGASPFFTAPEHGSVYLTGGYKGAPYGLAVVVRAIAGPYDLGTVVVRQAVFIDRDDAHLTVVSDPLPRVLRGVPLRLRSLDVRIDRPGFTLNPTSCAPAAIAATLSSTAGAQHRAAQRFQVGDCRALPFRPRLSLRLTRRSQMRDGGHPGVHAILKQPAGQANLLQAAVKLPLSLALDADNAQQLCEFADGQKAEPTCPRASIVGRAVAHTPILGTPLDGPVYFVKHERTHPRTGRQIRTLPALVIPLRGGGVALNIRATSSVKRRKLVTTFAGVPDAPLSRFDLHLDGGRNGILAVNGRPCTARRKQVADVELDGHSGRRGDHAVRIRLPCKKKKPASR
jgi:hypothetical protein